MAKYLGNRPTAVPLTSSDLEDSIVTSAKILDGTIVNADVNDLASSKLTGALPAIDGSNLTGISAGTTLTGSTNNTIPTVTGANAISGEANLTFDGTDLTLGTGDIVFGTAAKGIVLGATSNTASNTLDDYEFGNWTPAFSGSPSGSYTYQFGNFTKINKMVFFTGFIQGNFSGGSGSALITGLPFTPSSGSDNVYYEPVTIGFTYQTNTSLYQGFVQQTSTEMFLLGEPSSGYRTHVNISTIVSSDVRISVSGIYNTSA